MKMFCQLTGKLPTAMEDSLTLPIRVGLDQIKLIVHYDWINKYGKLGPHYDIILFCFNPCDRESYRRANDDRQAVRMTAKLNDRNIAAMVSLKCNSRRKVITDEEVKQDDCYLELLHLDDNEDKTRTKIAELCRRFIGKNKIRFTEKTFEREAVTALPVVPLKLMTDSSRRRLLNILIITLLFFIFLILLN